MEEPGGPGGSWRTRLRERVVPVCDSCVASTDVDGGSVALRSSSGVRDVLHVTDGVADQLEQIQSGLGEGPCVDAVAEQGSVLVDDITELGDRHPLGGREGDRAAPSSERQALLARRWSFFLPQATELGVRSLFAFPLRVGSVVLGSLELYRREPGPLRAAQLHRALQAAQEMSAAVLDQVTVHGGPAGPRGLDAGIGRAAATVHQAAGMVMVQIDGTIEEAMAQLRAAAFADGTGLVDLAAEVIRGRRRFGKGSV